MSKHGPIAAGPDDRPRVPRGPSLIERAANVYDFRASLRGTPGGAAAAAPVEAPRAFVAAPGVRPANRSGTVALDALEEGGFILPGRAPTALSEEFRVVKRQLLADAEGPARTILVCSARPDEGKTFCAINLAISLAAERDIEVLLVDADVAKPEVVRILGLDGGQGLLDAIADPATDVETLVIRTDVPRLSVLPAGGPTHDATELLASARTRDVLERLRAVEPKRVIVFDSPPALAASPAGVLAMYCGQAVFVVRAEETSEGDVREALGLLSACPRPQLLLNGNEFGCNSRRFGRYYGVEA